MAPNYDEESDEEEVSEEEEEEVVVTRKRTKKWKVSMVCLVQGAGRLRIKEWRDEMTLTVFALLCCLLRIPTNRSAL